MLGMPVALATLFAAVVLASPAKNRKTSLAAAGTCVYLRVSVTILGDIVYAFIVQGALRPNFWLDQAHISPSVLRG